jgi:hypothetical protein
MTLSKLEELFHNLLVIMHADKINAKKGKHPSLIKPQVLTLACCFFGIYRRSPHHKSSKEVSKLRV